MYSGFQNGAQKSVKASRLNFLTFRKMAISTNMHFSVHHYAIYNPLKMKKCDIMPQIRRRLLFLHACALITTYCFSIVN